MLTPKPGLDGSKVLSIPKDWNSTWYRDHVNNLLKGADVRNATGINGIKVSGNITSPYATIGLQGPITIPVLADDQNAIVVNEIATIVDGTTTLLQQYNGTPVGWFGFGQASASGAFVQAGDLALDMSRYGGANHMYLAWNTTPFVAFSVPDAAATTPVMGTWTGGAGAIAQVAVDIGNSAMMSYPSTGANAGQNLYIMANIYYDGSNYRYKQAGCAAEITLLGDSGHSYMQFLNAASGVAGAVATMIPIMNIGANGGVGGSGGVTILAPSTNTTALIVNTAGTSATLLLAAAAGLSPLLDFQQAGQSTWQILNDGTTSNFRIWNSNSGTTLSFTNTGQVSVAAASAGDSLIVHAGGGGYGFVVQAPAANPAGVQIAGNGNVVGTGDFLIEQNGSDNVLLYNRANGAIYFYTNNNGPYIQIDASGLTTIGPNTSGTVACKVEAVSSGICVQADIGAVGYYFSPTSGNALLMNCSGADYGAVGAYGTQEWALGFTGSQGTLLTPALSWGQSGSAAQLGFFGTAPVVRITGYGTPTGGSHQGSFAAGSITLANLAAAVAQLIIDLKSYGLIAA